MAPWLVVARGAGRTGRTGRTLLRLALPLHTKVGGLAEDGDPLVTYLIFVTDTTDMSV